MNRRQVLAIAAASLGAPLVARAQDNWPTRPVTLLVPFAAGGSNDVVARLVAPALEQKFGQPFIIDNRPGGGGSLGMGMVVRARPDGQTLLISSASNHVFHPLVSGDLGYDVREALVGVSMLTDVPTVLAANPRVGVSNVQELIAKVRATRGGMSFGSSGVGTSNHLAGELFRMRTNLDLTHLLLDLLGKPRTLIRFVTDRPGHDLRYAIDWSKAQRELGWSPQVSFRDGLQATIDWYLANPDWVARIKSGEYRTFYEAQYGARLTSA